MSMIITDRPVLIDTGPSPSGVTIVNEGPATVSYGASEQAVTDGTIIAGASIDIGSPKWLKCATGLRANVSVTSTDGQRIRLYDKDNAQRGLFGPTFRGWGTAAIVATATLHRYHRIVPSRNMTIVALGHFVTSAASNDDSVDFGLYDATLTKIISTGLTAGKANALDAQTVAITPTTLRAGVTYYYAHKYGTIGSTAATLAYVSIAGSRVYRVFGSTAGLIEAGDMTGLAADALPTTLTIQSTSANVCPAGILLEA